MYEHRANVEQKPLSTVLAGGLAGLAATAPMTVTMKALRQALPHQEQYALPPKQITRRMAGEQPSAPGGDQWGAATYLAHFGFGAAAGVAYAATARWLPVHPVVKGVGFGVFVWASSYLGWLPALRVLPPASQEPPGRNGVMIVSHLVWGAATGLITTYLSNHLSKARSP